MNSKIPAWVTIRDMQNDIMYQGYVVAFSDSLEKDEIFLDNVSVYQNSTGNKLYDVAGLYIPTKRENLIIEFQSLLPEQLSKDIEQLPDEGYINRPLIPGLFG
jgi:hypothetical protein